MADTIFKYPLDLLGTAVTNRVVGEEHVIGNRSQRIFALDYGPFFGVSAHFRDGTTNRTLIPEVDYLLLHSYREAEARTGQSVYAAVRIINPEVSNSVKATVQYVGGEFSYSTYAIIELLKTLATEDRPVYWGELIGVPSQFAPAPHEHSIYHTYGWKTMVDAVNNISASIREAGIANQHLLFEQLDQMSAELSDFANALATEFGLAADELAAL